ncbi:Fic family protein [Acinetobacter sp. YH12200]|uniref:Fic family protein n=1 Tax=Acinetobacter sp. YH12200 TaxID=2601139 RepID=UPI0015D15883|nr:Fic family protein [Acinetobacter sp. YH12200]
MFTLIDDLKHRLDQCRPLSDFTSSNIEEDLFLRLIYNSNAISGNKLSLLETKVVLEGIAIGGKTLEDHLQVINQRKAINYIQSIIRKKENFSTEQIFNIHLIISNNVNILHSDSTLPNYTSLIKKIAPLLDWYNTEAHKLHPVERAAKVHVDFVGIYPFIDANGRTSRLLMNLELLKAGYPPCIITVENRLAYYEALDQWMASGKTEAFIELVADAVLDGFKPYQVVLGI